MAYFCCLTGVQGYSPDVYISLGNRWCRVKNLPLRGFRSFTVSQPVASAIQARARQWLIFTLDSTGNISHQVNVVWSNALHMGWVEFAVTGGFHAWWFALAFNFDLSCNRSIGRPPVWPYWHGIDIIEWLSDGVMCVAIHYSYTVWFVSPVIMGIIVTTMKIFLEI